MDEREANSLTDDGNGDGGGGGAAVYSINGRKCSLNKMQIFV